MGRLWIVLGGINGFLAVALGAFGAHGLKARLSPEMLDVYKTGTQYQMMHALGLILIGLWAEQRANRRADGAGSLLMAGILLFSGTLYGYSLTGITTLAMITPLGGLCFLAGWIAFILAVIRDPARPVNGSGE